MVSKADRFCAMIRTAAGLLAILTMLALPAAAQTVAQKLAQAAAAANAAKRTPPPPNWMEQWVGQYGAVDQQGNNPPPGFTIVTPQSKQDDVAQAHSQAWARMRREATDFEYEDLAGICKPSGIFRANSVAAFQLYASPEKILLTGDAGGGIYTSGIRRIYLNRPHLENPPLTFFGDSVGHWEGDTLVVDTIGFNDNTWLGLDRSRHSNALHLVERFRFVLNGEYLEHIYIVDDPFALTEPYTMSRYHKKLPPNTPVEEKVCGENPEGRRSWAKLFNRVRHEWNDIRKTKDTPPAPEGAARD
jgi:hypothetical protein